MVLSDMKIRELVDKYNMIEDFDEANLQAVSYDFRSSDIIRTFSGHKRCIDLSKPVASDWYSGDLLITDGYEMMPNEYILVRVKERICLPKNIAGHVRPRTTYTKLGLILSGQHINPTFEGHLYVGMRNVTPAVIKIYPELVIGQLVFEAISGDVTEELLYKNKIGAKYQNEDEFIVPRIMEELPPALKLKYNELVRELAGEK